MREHGKSRGWRRIKIALAAAAIFGIGKFFWTITTIPDRASGYLQHGPTPVKVMLALDFVQITDRPGYSGAMGRYDAKAVALDAITAEDDAWEAMVFPGFSVFGPASLHACLKDVHMMRIEFFQESAVLATSNLIPSGKVRRLLNSMNQIDRKMGECSFYIRRSRSQSDKPVQTEVVATSSEHVRVNRGLADGADLRKEIVVPAAVERFPRTADFDETDECLAGLKRFVIGRSDAFTTENQQVIKKNCATKREEWLCFIKKVNRGHISMADEHQAEIACNLND